MGEIHSIKSFNFLIVLSKKKRHGYRSIQLEHEEKLFFDLLI